jgi:DNA-binding transcriptional MerR regulator
MTGTAMRIGQLAAELGTTAKTLRYYEEIGLLDPPARTEGGYRIYDETAVHQARLVVGLRQLGLTLDELHRVLHADDGSSLRQRLTALMDEKLRETDVRLGVLQGKRDDLAARHEALLTTPRDRPGHCVCEALLTPCTCGERERSGRESRRFS